MRAMRIAFLAVACCGRFRRGCRPSPRQLLAPHRAVYDLALDKASDRSGITGITGRMVYEFNGSACEGYTVTLPLRDPDRYAATRRRLTDQQTTTFEDADGKTFSFVTKSFVDQNLDKEIRGTATRDGKGVKIEIEKPEQQEHRPRDDPVSDAASGRSPRQGRHRRHVLRDQPVRRLRGRRPRDDHDGHHRQAGRGQQQRPGGAGAGQPRQGQVLAGRHRLFRRDQEWRRGDPGIPHQLQAAQERPHARPR